MARISTPTWKFFLATLLLVGGVGVFAVVGVRALTVSPVEPEAPAPKEARGPTAPAEDRPARLLIPSIGIDAVVQHVGIGKSGNMAVPTNYTDAGWYRYGTAPGYRGSAVMDGHVDNGLALPGVFKRLSELTKGDELVVITAGGEELHFTVTDTQTYHYQEVPIDTLFNRADKARLNLITCEGAWISGEKTYDHRLVIYAELSASR
jgi:sortase A